MLDTIPFLLIESAPMNSDTAMRVAAFAHIRQLLELRDRLSASDLAQGFQFGGVRVPLINPRRIRFATGRRNGIEWPPRDYSALRASPFALLRAAPSGVLQRFAL